MLLEDEERCEVEAAVEKVTIMLYRAAVHLQGKGCEPDLVFAAMINAAKCFAASNNGCTEAVEMTRELTERIGKSFSPPPLSLRQYALWLVQ